MSLEQEEAEILRHALGLSSIRWERPKDRNRYCVEVGGEAEKLCQALVAKGLMRAGLAINDGQGRYYGATPEGRAAVGDPRRLDPESGEWALPERVFMVEVKKIITAKIAVVAWSEDGAQGIALDAAEADPHHIFHAACTHEDPCEHVGDDFEAETLREITAETVEEGDADHGEWIPYGTPDDDNRTVLDILRGEKAP